MNGLPWLRLGVFAACLIGPLSVSTVAAHGAAGPSERLPLIRQARTLNLTAQDGISFSTETLRGKVIAVNFVFTQCTDVCPIATAKMVWLQKALGEQFGKDVFFVSVSVDPVNDTPATLERYARALGCDLSAWKFLTGSQALIREAARHYGVFHKRTSNGDIDHILLTSLVDREGQLRVQYVGEQFDPKEMLHDLRDLAAESLSK